VRADHLAYRYVEHVADPGMVQSYDERHYEPDIVVTRGQMAAYVAWAFALLQGPGFRV
jgi:hypothetical protein